MTEAKFVIEQLKQQGILPLFFHKDATTCIKIMSALYNAGIRIIEFTNRGDEALKNFAQLRQLRDTQLPSLVLGAGTIKTPQHAEDFIEAGADFIISPGLNEEVGRICREREVLWMPGCMTPSEIMRAEENGAAVIKIFPGNIVGPAFVGAVKEVFPNLMFIPTGGVPLKHDSLSAWFRSGVIAVGAGSTLISKAALESGDFEGLEKSASDALKLIEEARA